MTKWRVKVLQDLASSYYKGAQTKEFYGVVNLIHKFKFFKPELIPSVITMV